MAMHSSTAQKSSCQDNPAAEGDNLTHPGKASTTQTVVSISRERELKLFQEGKIPVSTAMHFPVREETPWNIDW